MTCGICSLLSTKKNVIYEDDKLFAYIPEKVAVPGHIIVAPKVHAPIIEQVPDDTLGSLFNIASKFSLIIFELFQAEGTNIFVQNGTAAGQMVAHSVVHVLPRRNKDDLALEWAPKDFSEDEMSTIALQLKEGAEKIAFEKEKAKPIELKETAEEIREKEDEVNYLIKQLERIP